MMQSNPAYSLHLDRASICEMAVSYMRLLLLDMGLAATVAYFVWGAILVLALVWRSPEFRFGALLFFCAAAPLLLIAPRSLYVFYLAYSGWCMLWAAALARIPLPPVVTLVAVAMVFGTWNLRAWPHAISWVPAEQAKVRCAIAAVKPLAPRIKPADRILITDDPFPADDYLLIFAFRLATRHEDLQAWRLRAHPQAAGWTDPWSMRLRIEGCKAVLEPLSPN